jgi:type III restriction enzyme
LIANGASKVAERSEGALEIVVSQPNNVKNILFKFEQSVLSSRGQSDRVRNFFKQFVADASKTYRNLFRFWTLLYSEKIGTVTEIESGISFDELHENDFLDSLDPPKIVELALMLPDYTLLLNYRKDSETKIPFEDASYGQQAGAILTILLNQELGPLIIDQPEDDLDNKIIHKITENIIAAKHKRQLIFTSHNANVAVNGDAELILCFEHNHDKSFGEIIESGSIDKPVIKEIVKDIMEGGKKAFDLRIAKYGF